MILVTGAAGKTGRAVLQALARRGEPARALVRRADQTEAVRAAGAGEVVIGDLNDAATLRGAAVDVRAVYHICPNMSPAEVGIGQALIAALREAAPAAHLVYHSVLHPQTEAMPHHWAKLRVEAAIFESGLAFTLLQPAPYMQNLLAGWRALIEHGVQAAPYPPATRLSLVDVEDVAEAAARVLTEPGHAAATYELCGSEGLTQIQVADILSQALARPVRAEAVALDDWERGARAAGLDDYARETLLKMFRYYECYGLFGNPQTLTRLLGRAPTTLAQFAARTQREFAGA